MTITGSQLKAARALAETSIQDLASESGVSSGLIEEFEQRGPSSLRGGGELQRLLAALERRGIAFSDDGGPGVKRTSPVRQEGLRPCDLDATNDD